MSIIILHNFIRISLHSSSYDVIFIDSDRQKYTLNFFLASHKNWRLKVFFSIWVFSSCVWIKWIRLLNSFLFTNQPTLKKTTMTASTKYTNSNVGLSKLNGSRYKKFANSDSILILDKQNKETGWLKGMLR